VHACATPTLPLHLFVTWAIVQGGERETFTSKLGEGQKYLLSSLHMIACFRSQIKLLLLLLLRPGAFFAWNFCRFSSREGHDYYWCGDIQAPEAVRGNARGHETNFPLGLRSPSTKLDESRKARSEGQDLHLQRLNPDDAKQGRTGRGNGRADRPEACLNAASANQGGTGRGIGDTLDACGVHCIGATSLFAISHATAGPDVCHSVAAKFAKCRSHCEISQQK